MQENQVTLFVGDTDQSLSTVAKKHDPDAFLINHSNYKEFLTTKTTQAITIYTSLGDLPKDLEVFFNIAMTTTKIVYVPPDKWSDNQPIDSTNPTACVQGLTEHILLLISNYRPVENLEMCYLNPTVNPLVDSRKSINPQLWVAGCSFTEGVGVDISQRYGQLVATSLALPASFLAKRGSSISWAADQILRSDIRPNDIVVWGITSTARVTCVDQDQLLNVKTSNYQDDPAIEKIIPLHLLIGQTTFYSHLYAIEQVINYCKKCQAKLMLIGILPSDNMLRYLKNKSNYFHFMYNLDFSNNQIYNKYIDLGNDQKHPGINQHKQYADFILKHI